MGFQMGSILSPGAISRQVDAPIDASLEGEGRSLKNQFWTQ